MATAPLAGASQHGTRTGPHTPSARGCRLSLYVEPHRLTAGDETPQLFGRLTCAKGAETAGQAVTVYEHLAGHATQTIGTATTQTGGYYTFLAPAPVLDTVYYVSAAGATSLKRQVRVAPQVTISGPAEGSELHTGAANRATFSGTVSPAAAGAIVVLQREAATAHEEWVVIQHGIVGAGGTYTFVHDFLVPGDANIRVLVRAHGRYTVYGASSQLSYVISQAQNPLLTLVASSAGPSGDPVSYGETVTLAGTLAGGANRPVALWARTAGGSFTKIASATANAAGQYRFEETPLQDTSYRVIAPHGAKSSVLFEGVRYLLTAAVSATSAQAGQTLTFSGTITPYRAGHTVYLERENAGGSGFHVVGVASMSAPPAGSSVASYSISHTVFGTGTQVYRVKVPGDPANQGRASAPFTIEVKPAAASALSPAPPSRLPTEGAYY